MEKSFQTNKILLVLYLCIAVFAKDVTSQTSSIKDGHIRFPYRETAFEVLGLFHSDSLLVVRNTYKQNLMPLFFWEKAQCSDYYLSKVQDKDNLPRLLHKIGRSNCEQLILLGFSEVFMESLYLQDEMLPNYGIKDSLLAALVSSNRWYFKDSNAIYHDLYDSLKDNEKEYISTRKNLEYTNLTHIYDFLLLRMTVFEYKLACQTLCSCNGASVSYPMRSSDNRKVVFVAVPIAKEVMEKYNHSLRTFYIEDPWNYVNNNQD